MRDMTTSATFNAKPHFARRLCVGLAVLLGAVAAQAQTAEAFAPNTILVAALQTLQQIDQKKGNELYAQAPAFVQSAIKKNAFTKGLAQERDKLGTVTARQRLGINRVVATPAPNQPPVACANVHLAALNQNTLAGSEQVSLCWEQQQWRATGYVVTKP